MSDYLAAARAEIAERMEARHPGWDVTCDSLGRWRAIWREDPRVVLRAESTPLLEALLPPRGHAPVYVPPLEGSGGR